jgi:SpoVK/Ycf46/Vps4 family AAA+-type ATPase
LDFLQNRPRGVYIVGTANSFDGIPNEYLRPGRWDTSPFFIDYPTRHVAKAILKHYCKKENVKYEDIELNNFSGAEIESLVNIASMRGLTLKKALPLILPQAKTCYESIERLRAWAKDRTIPAESLPVASVKNVRKIDA